MPLGRTRTLKESKFWSEEFLKRHDIRTPATGMAVLPTDAERTPIIRPGEPEHESIVTAINAIEREYARAEDAYHDSMLGCLVKILFLALERSRPDGEPAASTGRGAIFAAFGSLLEENMCATRNARDYADMLGVSYKNLNEICKEFAHLTAKECVDRALILEIERRLATVDLSAKELSAEMGFDEPTNFAKFFKARTGLTPARFRESIR